MGKLETTESYLNLCRTETCTLIPLIKARKKTGDEGAKRLSTHQGEDAVSDGHQSSVSIQSIQDSLGIVKKSHYNQMAGENAKTADKMLRQQT